jgi:hypothetical protein
MLLQEIGLMGCFLFVRVVYLEMITPGQNASIQFTCNCRPVPPRAPLELQIDSARVASQRNLTTILTAALSLATNQQHSGRVLRRTASKYTLTAILRSFAIFQTRMPRK